MTFVDQYESVAPLMGELGLHEKKNVSCSARPMRKATSARQKTLGRTEPSQRKSVEQSDSGL